MDNEEKMPIAGEPMPKTPPPAYEALTGGLKIIADFFFNFYQEFLKRTFSIPM